MIAEILYRALEVFLVLTTGSMSYLVKKITTERVMWAGHCHDVKIGPLCAKDLSFSFG